MRLPARSLPSVVKVGLIGCLLVVWATAKDGASSVVIWSCLVVWYSLFLPLCLRPRVLWKSIPTYATVEILFLLFSFVIYYLPYQLYVLGLSDLQRSRYVPNTFWEQSNRAVILATIAVLAFSVGCQPRRIVEKEETSARVGQPATSSAPRRVRMVEPALIAHAVLAGQVGLIMLYVAAGYRSANEGRYTGTTTGGVAAEGVYLLILMLCMLAIALAVAAMALEEKVRSSLKIALVVSVAWCIRMLALGDRNSFLLIALVAIIGLVTFKWRASRLLLAGLLVFSFVLYNAVEVARRSGSTNPIEIINGIISPEDPASANRRAVPESNETSFNITSIGVRAAIAEVPGTYPHGFGRYQVIGATGIFPLIRGYVIPKGSFDSSSDVLVAIMLPPSAQHGVGTSVVADTFIDFGVLGVPILLFGLGRLVRRFEYRVAVARDPRQAIAMYLLAAALIAEVPRYALMFPVRILTWAAVLMFALSARTRSTSGPRHERPEADDGHRRQPARSAR